MKCCADCGSTNLTTKKKPGKLVSNYPLAVAFRHSECTAKEVAIAADWWTAKGYADTQRVRKSLGFVKSEGAFRTKLRYETALTLCHAIGCDPVDVGL